MSKSVNEELEELKELEISTNQTIKNVETKIVNINEKINLFESEEKIKIRENTNNNNYVQKLENQIKILNYSLNENNKVIESFNNQFLKETIKMLNEVNSDKEIIRLKKENRRLKINNNKDNKSSKKWFNVYYFIIIICILFSGYQIYKVSQLEKVLKNNNYTNKSINNIYKRGWKIWK